MDILREWIVGVTAASILVAAVVALAPGGTAKKTVRFAGGLVIFIALVGPLGKINFEDISYFNMQARADYKKYEEKYIFENSSMVGVIVSDKLATYVMEKASEYGIECEVSVRVKQHDEGHPFPVEVSIDVISEGEPQARKRLSTLIEAELGVPEERQKWGYADEQE